MAERKTISLDNDLKELKSLAQNVNKTNEELKNDKNVLFQMRLPESERNLLKGFFANMGVPMSDGLLKAVYYCKKKYEEGKISFNRNIGFFDK